jgi:hypothetical protein
MMSATFLNSGGESFETTVMVAQVKIEKFDGFCSQTGKKAKIVRLNPNKTSPVFLQIT